MEMEKGKGEVMEVKGKRTGKKTKKKTLEGTRETQHNTSRKQRMLSTGGIGNYVKMRKQLKGNRVGKREE